MEIKREFTLNGLEYSKILPKEYTWIDLKKVGFKFQDGWRVPNRSELTMLFDSVEESRYDANLWSSSSNNPCGDMAWYVFFEYGSSYLFDTSYPLGLRLVRDINND